VGKGDRYVGLTTLPAYCADCQEIYRALTCWNPQGLSRPVQELLYRYIHTCVHTYVSMHVRTYAVYQHTIRTLPKRLRCCVCALPSPVKLPISEILSILLASIMIHCYQILCVHKFRLGASECVLTFTIHSFLSFLCCKFNLTSGVNICMRLTDQ